MIQWLKLSAEATSRSRVNCIPAAIMLVLAGALVAGCGKGSAAPATPQALPLSVVQVEPSDVPVSNEWAARSTAMSTRNPSPRRTAI